MKNEIYFYKDGEDFLKTKIIYDKNEMGFLTEKNYAVDFTIMTGAVYLGLDICLNNSKLLKVSGCCPDYNWKRKKLRLPERIENGLIDIKTDINLIPGTGIDLEEELDIYYCSEDKLICVGDNNVKHYDTNIKFMENAIISLKNNEFKALWISDITL